MSGKTRHALSRRQWLVRATAATGGLGIAVASIPFIETMAPSEAAKAAGAPVELDIGQLAPAALVTVEWRGRPVWVLHRSAPMLALLGRHPERLADPDSRQDQQPDYARNATRSIRPPVAVLTGICTHLGCVPSYRPEVGPPDLGADWQGGFYCPCHGSRFDLAGRVFKNVPAPRNLEIPPHQYVGSSVLRIGADLEHPEGSTA